VDGAALYGDDDADWPLGRGRPDIGLMSLFGAVFCGILARQ
jgi:hypothetical protein